MVFKSYEKLAKSTGENFNIFCDGSMKILRLKHIQIHRRIMESKDHILKVVFFEIIFEEIEGGII
jgi:hypothetical protein